MLNKLVERAKHTKIVWLLLLFSVAFLVVAPSVGNAQVVIEESFPKPESILREAPAEIEIQVSEYIPNIMGQLLLKDEQGSLLAQEMFEKGSTFQMDVPLLEDGTYFVHWQVLDTDVQVTGGAFRFMISHEDAETEATLFNNIFSNNDSNIDDQQESKLSMLSRAGKLVIMLCVAGWIIFHYLFWSKEGERNVRLASHMKLRIERRLYIISALLMLLLDSTHILQQSADFLGSSWDNREVLQLSIAVATSSMFGVIALVRICSLVLLIALTFLHSFKYREGLKVILGVILIISFSWSQHAYLGNVFVSHSVHLLLLTVWFAGLLGFGIYSFVLKSDTLALSYIHKRLAFFSKLSIYLLLFTVGSGLLLSFGYVGSWTKLFSTSYGVILLWKLVLFTPVLLIATLHRLVWWPSLIKVQSEQYKKQGINALLWGLRIELLLALAVTIISGILSQTDPPVDLEHLRHDHDVHIHLDSSAASTPDEIMLEGFVLKDRKRLEGAKVTFDLWDKKHEDLFSDIQNYCNANNIRLDVFMDVLAERGVVQSSKGKETSDHTYQAVLQLDAKVWTVNVTVEHEALEGGRTSQEFTLAMGD
ncbi:copper resistance CopC/CopD family protein [Bacillus horti]|nr:CopD family protein [Bacillus horti]